MLKMLFGSFYRAICNLQYTLAMMGYADELETTVLELTYNYGVTEYTKGNAYAQVNLLYTFLHLLVIYFKWKLFHSSLFVK